MISARVSSTDVVGVVVIFVAGLILISVIVLRIIVVVCHRLHAVSLCFQWKRERTNTGRTMWEKTWFRVASTVRR